MKKLFSLVITLALTQMASAIPAKRVTQIVRQSDGTKLAVQLRGDETFHYYVTTDGKPVRQNEQGDWVADTRDVQTLHRAALARRNHSRLQLRDRVQKAMRAVRAPYRIGEVTTKRGLLILVNFQDKTMTNGEQSNAIFDQELNAIGNPYGENYGSIREYFRDQSYGQFDIEFDVVGPVTVSKKMEYYGRDNGSEGEDAHPGEMVAEACRLADEKVDFSNYDWDGNGEVENIYVIYAGYGQASGAPANTIWPHQWALSDPENYGRPLTLDGVTIDTYACGSELYGTSGKTIDGVGTMCHEYSHCLGLPDFYDTNYKAIGMSYWSVLDGGCYNGDGYCPAGYTAYERYFCNWLTPVELNAETIVEGMKNIEENAEAYIIYNDKSKDEYYLLANHQLVGWDKEAYGHGMMVLHVDYDQTAWFENTVNDVASRQRMTIIPADGKFIDSTQRELAGDLWPGIKKNTALTDETTPAATLNRANTDGKKLMHKPITNIAEKEGLISFSFMKGLVQVDAPVLSNEFTNVDSVSFTATWSKVEAAASYNIVLTEQESADDDIIEAMNLYEDFEGFYIYDEDATSDSSTDLSGSLDDYTFEPGWTGSKIYQGLYGAKLGTSKAAGVITTPIIEGKTGTMTLFLEAYDWFNYNTWITRDIYTTDNTMLIISLLDEEGKELQKLEVKPNDFTKTYEWCVLNFSRVPEKYQVSVATNGAKKRAYIDYLITFDGTFSEDEISSLFDVEEEYMARRMVRRNAVTTFPGVKGTSYTFKDLTPGATYSVQVQAVDADGNTSDFSNTESITLPNSMIDAVHTVKAPTTSRPQAIDLTGRKVAAPHRRGFYIVNGKKVIVK